jgi:tRNA-binding EMAP/Myf-like protein
MSDPRNVAHAKKVTQEKKHEGTGVRPADAPAGQPGKKPSVAKKKDDPAAPNETAAVAAPSEGSAVKTPAALEASLVVLGKLKELEFHSRANLERLAELTLTVEDELKQKAIVSPLAEVYSAQSVLQTKLTALIEAYKAECDRMQGESV